MVAATAAVPSPASANFASAVNGFCHYSDVKECYADSFRHNVDWDLGPKLGNATLDSLYNTYDTTELVISISGSVNDGTHSANVDVYYRNGPLASGEAITSCQTPVDSSNYCNHWHVIYYGDAISAIRDDPAFYKTYACHETGHTVGLEHPIYDSHGRGIGDTFFGCMRDGSYLYPESPYLGAHGAAHINAFYYPF